MDDPSITAHGPLAWLLGPLAVRSNGRRNPQVAKIAKACFDSLTIRPGPRGRSSRENLLLAKGWRNTNDFVEMSLRDSQAMECPHSKFGPWPAVPGPDRFHGILVRLDPSFDLRCETPSIPISIVRSIHPVFFFPPARRRVVIETFSIPIGSSRRNSHP